VINVDRDSREPMGFGVPSLEISSTTRSQGTERFRRFTSQSQRKTGSRKQVAADWAALRNREGTRRLNCVCKTFQRKRGERLLGRGSKGGRPGDMGQPRWGMSVGVGSAGSACNARKGVLRSFALARRRTANTGRSG